MVCAIGARGGSSAHGSMAAAKDSAPLGNFSQLEGALEPARSHPSWHRVCSGWMSNIEERDDACLTWRNAIGARRGAPGWIRRAVEDCDVQRSPISNDPAGGRHRPGRRARTRSGVASRVRPFRRSGGERAQARRRGTTRPFSHSSGSRLFSACWAFRSRARGFWPMPRSVHYSCLGGSWGPIRKCDAGPAAWCGHGEHGHSSHGQHGFHWVETFAAHPASVLSVTSVAE